MTRIEIAKELQTAHLIDDFEDFCNVTQALRQGKSRDFILYEMSELERWRKAFVFLHDNLGPNCSETLHP